MLNSTADASPAAGRPLLDAIQRRSSLSWPGLVAATAIVLGLGLLLVAITDGAMTKTPWNEWRGGIQSPVLICYILLAYPFVRSSYDRTMETMASFSGPNVAAARDIVSKYASPRRVFELFALAAGAAFILALNQPWRGEASRLDVYALATNVIVFALLGYLLYHAFRRAYYVERLSRLLTLDVFGVDALMPVARQGLALSVALMGGILISILFQPMQSLIRWESLLVYSLLLASTVVVFFLSSLSVHGTIKRLKREELAFVSRNLKSALHELKRQTLEGAEGSRARTYDEIASWGVYAREIERVREWPFKSGVTRQLLLSVVTSFTIYYVKVALAALGVHVSL